MPASTSLSRALLPGALFVMVSACTVPPAANPPAPVRGPRGVDVASHQHPDGKPIDWPTVKRAGITFAFVKADEGPHGRFARYVNPYFKQDWDGARAAGILVGPYHYARPRQPIGPSADADARAFIAMVGPSVRTAGLPPVLDLEESGGLSPVSLAAWVRQWLASVEAVSGRTPIIYTGLWNWIADMASTPEFAEHPLWLARYAPTVGLLPGGWRTWSFWQYTSRGSVSGIPAAVDLNVSCGKVTELVNECRAGNYAEWAANQP